MVRATGKHVFFVLGAWALSSAALAQRTPKPDSRFSDEPSPQLVHSSSARLLNTDEGMAVIGAALQARNTLRPYGDCSHLVHTIYEQAGFHYPYADSTDLYSGIPEFRQVTRPQPGDLAVWRGHAAILVNPAQHTFFSATRSGLRVESYDLAYWKRRGAPRFFRYMKSASAGSPSITRTAASTTNPRSFESRAPSKPEVTDDPPSNDDVDNESAPGSPAGPFVLHSLRPTPQQLNEALARYLGETEKSFGSRDVLRSSQPVLVFDQIVVRDVHIKKDQAWAEIKIDGASYLTAGRASPKKRSEQQRWTLIRRDSSTWELQLPLGTTYLPHDVAVRILAHQLAALADRSPEASGDSSKDQAQLARTLNSLLEK
jgi:NlpC/P60 family protein